MNPENKIDILSRLTPEMAEVIRIQQERSGEGAFSTDATLEDVRNNYVEERKYWNEGGPEMVRAADVNVETTQGVVSVRVLSPNSKAVNSCLFYIHGGGMVVGSNATHDRIMRMLARHADSVVAGIEYSLAPEAKYPKALLECVDVARHFRAHAAEYGIDPDSIGLAGDSGGASLSLGAALWLRDHEPDISWIRALLLYYGTYGLKDGRSYKLYGGPLDGLSEDDLNYYAAMYRASEQDADDPYLNAYNNDLTCGIPPCFIAGCELDPLLDDSRALYEILSAKGSPCEYREYEGALHGFLHYSRVMKAAEEALVLGAQYFKARQ